jgi:hypothetical protein
VQLSFPSGIPVLRFTVKVDKEGNFSAGLPRAGMNWKAYVFNPATNTKSNTLTFTYKGVGDSGRYEN